jgi:DNA-binding transcriptional LysR family regulator
MVTQPAISIAIKKLESEYGELINRKSKTFALTQMGERLLKWAVSIHKEVTNMSRELRTDFPTRRETIKIALPMALCPELMTGLATTFVNQHAEISIQILQKGHLSIVNDLINRTVDVGVLCKDMLNPMLESKNYRAVEFYAFFSNEHRFNTYDSITPEMLKDEVVLSSQTVNSISAPLQNYFLRHNIQPDCVYYDILPEDARKMAQRGTEIAFGPKYAGVKNSAPLSPPLYSELAVAWLKGTTTRQEEYLIDFIVESGQERCS